MTISSVLFVHGGREVGYNPVGRFDAPVLRMELFRAALGRGLKKQGLALPRFRFSVQGWNEDGVSAIADLRRAIEALGIDDHSVILVGHSMGGRTSLRLAGHAAVAGVIGLAPWCPEGEPLAEVSGKRLILAHGTEDVTTLPGLSAELAERARDAGANVTHTLVPGEGHALLKRQGWWNQFILDGVAELRASD